MLSVRNQKCPECGAVIQIAKEKTEVTCAFCGTKYVLERPGRKTAVPPAPAPGAPAPRVLKVPAVVPVLVLLFFGLPILLVIVGIAVAAVQVSSAVGTGVGSGGTAGQSLGEHMQWVGFRQPMLAELNGDGVADVVGWIRFISGSSNPDHLAAFNGATGERLWVTSPLVDSAQSHNAKAAIAQDKALVADPTGMLRAFFLGNGQPSWTSPLGERAERFCGGATAQTVRVVTTDKRVLAVDLGTGQVAPDKGSDCGPIWTDEAGRIPGIQASDGSFGSEDNPEIPGMRVSRALRTAGGVGLALGEKAAGTRVPAVASFQDGRKTKVLWVAAVPAQNPLTVAEGAPEIATLSMSRAVVPYRMADSQAGWRLACLDLNTGLSAWDVPVPRSDAGDVDAVVASDRQVYVSHWTYLDIFDLATGAHRLTIGVW